MAGGDTCQEEGGMGLTQKYINNYLLFLALNLKLITRKFLNTAAPCQSIQYKKRKKQGLK